MLLLRELLRAEGGGGWAGGHKEVMGRIHTSFFISLEIKQSFQDLITTFQTRSSPCLVAPGVTVKRKSLVSFSRYLPVCCLCVAASIQCRRRKRNFHTWRVCSVSGQGMEAFRCAENCYPESLQSPFSPEMLHLVKLYPLQLYCTIFNSKYLFISICIWEKKEIKAGSGTWWYEYKNINIEATNQRFKFPSTRDNLFNYYDHAAKASNLSGVVIVPKDQ